MATLRGYLLKGSYYKIGYISNPERFFANLSINMIHICLLYVDSGSIRKKISENFQEKFPKKKNLSKKNFPKITTKKLRLKILTGDKRGSFGCISMLSVLKRQKTPLFLNIGSLVVWGLSSLILKVVLHNSNVSDNYD